MAALPPLSDADVLPHLAMARAYARRAARRFRLDPDDAESEALFALARSLPRYDPARGKLDVWLGYSVWHALLELGRARARRAALARFSRLEEPYRDRAGRMTSLAGELADRGERPGAALEGAEEAGRLLRGLTPEERRVLWGHAVLGATFAALAASEGKRESRLRQVSAGALAWLRWGLPAAGRMGEGEGS